MTRHLAVVRLAVPGDSFSGTIVDRTALASGEWAQGPEALEASRQTDSELAAVLDFAAAKPDWRPVVLRSAVSATAGVLDDDVFTALYDEVLDGLARQRWDAVYLALHGTALTTRRVRPELGLIAAVRTAIGDAALGASFDARANLAPELARYLTYASACRSCPPIDRRVTAARVLDRLSRTAEGRLRPIGAVAKAALIVPEAALRGDGAMGEVLALARAVESRRLLDVSVCAGSADADAPDAGAGVIAYADGDKVAARRAAAMIAHALDERRQAFRAAASPELSSRTYRKTPPDLRPGGGSV